MGCARARRLGRVARLGPTEGGVLVLIPVPGSRTRGEKGARSLGRSHGRSDKGGMHMWDGLRRTETDYVWDETRRMEADCVASGCVRILLSQQISISISRSAVLLQPARTVVVVLGQ
jgi:hypothetical protein